MITDFVLINLNYLCNFLLYFSYLLFNLHFVFWNVGQINSLYYYNNKLFTISTSRDDEIREVHLNILRQQC